MEKLAIADLETVDAERAHDFISLQDSLHRVRGIDDPIQRHFGIVHEAQALGMREEEYKTIFREYTSRTPLHDLLLERPLGKLVAWLGSLSLFKLLEYIGRMAVLLAMGSFLLAIPQRAREAQTADLRVIEDARDKVYSKARQQAMERLGSQCVNLEGLDARQADLQGLTLEPCFHGPIAATLGPWMPMLFSRSGVSLHGALLEGAQLEHARLAQADLRGASLAGAHLAHADLSGVDLTGADLRGADLFRAKLRGARFAGVVLDHADLSMADLQNTDLTRAHLKEATLLWADLRGAQLQHATLTGVNAIRSDLRDADLFAADLRGARLRLALTNGRTSLDQAHLQGADLRRTALSTQQIRLGTDGHQARTDDTVGWKPGPPKLVLLTYPQSSFFSEVVDAATAAARAQHADLQVSYFKDRPDKEEQEEQERLQTLIDEGEADAIIVAPRHAASANALRHAHESGVVLVCYDQCLSSPDRDRFLFADHESDQAAIGRAGGEMVARWLTAQPRRASPVRIGIARFCDADGCYRRLQGFRAALDAASVNWVEVVRGTLPGDHTPQAAGEALLAQRDGTQLFWASNQDGTEGLVEAALAQGLAGQVRIWGTDFSPQIKAMLHSPQHLLQAVVAQQPKEMGRRAINSAVAALRREGRAFEDEKIPLVRHEMPAVAGRAR